MFAVTRWHYSHTMPTGKLVKVGAWERGDFIGAVLFGWGANRHMAGAFGLDQTEAAELVRVALTSHEAPTSRIVAGAVRLLRAANPGLRLLVSYADPAHGHVGVLYQALGWFYTGTSSPQAELRGPDGRAIHKRSYTGRGALPRPAGSRWFSPPPKHRYVYPLDRQMRRHLALLAQPYPKRPDG